MKERNLKFNKILLFNVRQIVEIGQCYSVTCSFSFCHSQSFCQETQIGSEICFRVEKGPYSPPQLLDTYSLKTGSNAQNCNAKHYPISKICFKSQKHPFYPTGMCYEKEGLVAVVLVNMFERCINDIQII